MISKSHQPLLNSGDKKELSVLVSIIIPVFNRSVLVTEALDSVSGQEYRPLEIIVVDDGSSDSTSEVVINWANAKASDDGLIVRYIYKDNGGPGSARNRGISEANGKYILFLDSDDCLLAGAVSNLVKNIAGGSAVVAGAILGKKDSEVDKSELIFLPGIGEAESTLDDFLSGKLSINCGCWLLELDFVKSLPRFREDINIAEDSIYFLRLILEAFHVNRLYKPVLYMRDHNFGRLTDGNSSISVLLGHANWYSEIFNVAGNRLRNVGESTKKSIINRAAKTAVDIWAYNKKKSLDIVDAASSAGVPLYPIDGSIFYRMLWVIGGVGLCAFMKRIIGCHSLR